MTDRASAEREAFERWLSDALMPSESSPSYLLEKDGDGDYERDFVADIWKGWQGRADLKSTPAAGVRGSAERWERDTTDPQELIEHADRIAKGDVPALRAAALLLEAAKMMTRFLDVRDERAAELKRLYALVEQLKSALEFYRLEAAAICKNMADGKHGDALLASLTVLSLDGGKRAREAVTSTERT